ncbi:MAG TPA: hypothetical protein VKF63_09475 [Terracidiphilus sp.]|nr:hypothetical protein [Terracidiphilus sp.]
MAKLFSVSGFAAAAIATRCSGSVGVVIADNAIAAQPVRPKPAANSGVVPTVGTSNPRTGAKIIATGSGSIANAGRKKA